MRAARAALGVKRRAVARAGRRPGGRHGDPVQQPVRARRAVADLPDRPRRGRAGGVRRRRGHGRRPRRPRRALAGRAPAARAARLARPGGRRGRLRRCTRASAGPPPRASASCSPTGPPTDERLRIARELHDAVGHDVSLMVVQAQALGAVAQDPAVREGTEAIAALGRRTMGEMHRTLRVLRDDAARAPQPTLERARRRARGRPRGGRAADLRGRGRPAPAGPRAGRVRVPDRPGGGHERRPPRRRGRGRRSPSATARRRSSWRSATTGRAARRARRAGPRARRDARARRHVRRHARGRARATSAGSRSGPCCRTVRRRDPRPDRRRPAADARRLPHRAGGHRLDRGRRRGRATARRRSPPPSSTVPT